MKYHLLAYIALLPLAIFAANQSCVQAREARATISDTNVNFLLPINGSLNRVLSYKKQTFGNLATLCKSREEGNTDQAVSALVSPPSFHEGSVEITSVVPLPVVIDNDLEKDEAVEEEYKWQELKDEIGKTNIQAGARFPVVISSALSSKTAHIGDPVQARLKIDLKIGGQLIAPKGSNIVGHVTTAAPARRILSAELSLKRWMRASGALGIAFDEIITTNGDHLPLVATPAKQSRIVKNSAEGRILGVNSSGEVATPLSIQLKHQAIHLAIRGAASAGGVLSFGIVPVAYGVVGAMRPDFAFLHPVGKNVPHRRLKGFAMGMVSGLPGGFLIADSIIKGQEATIKPGDEFLAEFKQDFTGEASTNASLMPNASTRVHGQVLPEKK